MSEVPSSKPAQTSALQAPSSNPNKVSQWAKIAEKEPTNLRKEIEQATLDELNELAKLILEKRQPEVNMHVREVIAERRRKLEENKGFDTSLSKIESRLYLARLLEIRSPAKEEPSTLDSMVAGSLRWVGGKTKDWWGMKGFSEGLRNLKGRDLERSFYNLLAFFGKMGQTIPGVSYLPIGLALKFGERKVAEMDVGDTINEKRFAGEKITFAGISSAEWDRWSAANGEKARTGQPVPLLPDLTKTAIDGLRRENYLQGRLTEPLQLTFKAIVDQKDRDTTVKSLEDDRKKQEAIAAWKPAHVTDIKAGTPPAAVRSGESWSVTVPETEMTAKGPYSPQATLLRDAMKDLAEAKEIVILTETERCEIDLERKIVRLPARVDMPDMATLHRVMMNGKKNPGITKIVFGKHGDLPYATCLARFTGGGTLTISAHQSRNFALESIDKISLSNARDGDEFEFDRTTGWKPAPQGVPVRNTK